MKNLRGMSRFAAVAVALVAAASQAKAVDMSVNGGRVNSIYGNTLTARQANSFAGELFSDVMGASITVQREFRKALPSIYSYSQTAHHQNRADLGFASRDALASAADGEAAIVSTVDPGMARIYCPTSMCAPDSKWVMWDVPFMIKDTKKRKDNFLGYEQSVSGFATGISYMLGEASAIGLAVGYDYRKLDGRDLYHMRDRADTFHAALFGGTNIGRVFLDGYAGYSRSWHRTERAAFDPGSVLNFDRNAANFNDTVLSAGLKASYVWILPNDVRITPSAGIDYSHVRFSGATEKGRNTATGANSNTLLRARKNTYDAAAIPLMVSLNRTFSWNRLCFGGERSLWTPEVRGGYVPQIGAKRASTRNTFVSGANNGASFRARSTTMTDNYGTVGAGMKMKIRDKYIFAVDYDYAFSSKYQNHSLTAMYGVSF